MIQDKSMIFMKRLGTCMLLILCALNMWAFDFEHNGFYYNFLDGNDIEVTYQDYYNDNYEGKTVANIPPDITHLGIEFNVMSIGKCAFWNCATLSTVNISYGTEMIEDDAFSKCPALTSVNIPNSVTNIGARAFLRTALATITIPNNVKTIRESTFSQCESLRSAIIPNSVTTIEKYAFQMCSSLDYIVCNATDVPQLGVGVFSGITQSLVTLYVPEESIEKYKEAEQWKEFRTILPLEQVPSALDNVDASTRNIQKQFRNGRLLILRDGVEYNAMGQEL
jgi:hypothetical protein